jgi:hypothetical protein
MIDSKKMRYLDKLLGSVICRFFSLIHFFKVGRKNRPIKNILVIELFEMGVAISSYPSIKYIKLIYYPVLLTLHMLYLWVKMNDHILWLLDEKNNPCYLLSPTI